MQGESGDPKWRGASLFHYRVAFSRPELRFRPWNGPQPEWQSTTLQHNAKQGEQGCAPNGGRLGAEQTVQCWPKWTAACRISPARYPPPLHAAADTRGEPSRKKPKRFGFFWIPACSTAWPACPAVTSPGPPPGRGPREPGWLWVWRKVATALNYMRVTRAAKNANVCDFSGLAPNGYCQ